MLPLFIFLHYALLGLAPSDQTFINIVSSAAFQIGGGLLVLYTINSNLYLISNLTIKETVLNWIRSFPLKGGHLEIVIDDTIQAQSSVTDEIRHIPKSLTIEDKVEYLLNEVVRIDARIDNTKKDLERSIQNNYQILDQEFTQLQENIAAVGANVKGTVVGGAKLEILGVLFIIYGLLIPVIY